MSTYTVAGIELETEFEIKPGPGCDWSAAPANFDLGSPYAHGDSEADAIAELLGMMTELDNDEIAQAMREAGVPA